MISALVVGLGQIGMGYDANLDSEGFVLTHARAFKQHPKFRLMGGVDPDSIRRKLFENQYRCKSYASIDDAYRDLDPDILAISNPTESHGQTLIMALDVFQPKCIICEKPLSYEFSEAQKMVELCASQNCRLYVNYMRRSDPGVIEVKKRIADGSILSPVKGIAWYSKGLFNNGSHLFNLLQFWLGDVQDFKILQTGRLWNKVDPEPDALVIFERGNIYFLAAKEENFSHYTIELIGSNGLLRYEKGGELVLWQQVISDPCYEGYKILSTVDEIIETGMQRYQLNVVDQIARDIDGHDANVCRGSDALQTLRWLDEIRSAL